MEEQFDPKIGSMEDVEILSQIGVNMIDLADPLVSRRASDIIDFFKGKEDKNYVLNKLSSQTEPDRVIEHVYRFISLRKEKDRMINELQNLDRELESYA